MKNDFYIDAIKAYMYENQKNQDEMAKLLSVTPASLSNWLKGTHGITAKHRINIERICSTVIKKFSKKEVSGDGNLTVDENNGKIKQVNRATDGAVVKATINNIHQLVFQCEELSLEARTEIIRILMKEAGKKE